MPATDAVGEKGWKELQEEGKGGCLMAVLLALMPMLAAGVWRLVC